MRLMMTITRNKKEYYEKLYCTHFGANEKGWIVSIVFIPNINKNMKYINKKITRWLKETVRSQSAGVKIEEAVAIVEDDKQ